MAIVAVVLHGLGSHVASKHLAFVFGLRRRLRFRPEKAHRKAQAFFDATTSVLAKAQDLVGEIIHEEAGLMNRDQDRIGKCATNDANAPEKRFFSMRKAARSPRIPSIQDADKGVGEVNLSFELGSDVFC